MVLVALSFVPVARGQQAASDDAVPVVSFEVNAFNVLGNNPLSAEQTQAVLADFTGPHNGLEGLLAAADALESALRKAGHAFYRVNLPGQTLQGGTVNLEVGEVPLTGIEVKGNDFTAPDTVLRSIPSLEVGKAPDTRTLSRDLLLANEHGSRRTDVRFSIDRETGGLGAILDLKEREPDGWFATLSNTGTPQSDDYRSTIGYSHANLFERDHNLGVTYTTAPRQPAKVSQFGLTYAIPLYQYGGMLRFSVSDSDVDSGRVAAIDINGAGRFYSVSYKQHFRPIGRYRHAFTLGLDDKKFIDNSVPKNTNAGIGVSSRSRPLSFRYDAAYKHSSGTTSGYITYSRNLPIGDLNDDRTYNFRRQGASSVWHHLKLGGRFTYFLADAWFMVGRIDMQLTGQALIPGEQFGIGGASTVRGYDERVASRDSGGFGSLEIWSPPMTDYKVRFLTFVDAGYVKTQKLVGLVEREQLSSIGLGARWQDQDKLSVSVDVAKVLNTIGQAPNQTKEGHAKIHFNVLYKF